MQEVKYIRFWIEKEVDELNGCYQWVVKRRSEQSNGVAFESEVKRFSEAFYESSKKLRGVEPIGDSAYLAAVRHEQRLYELYNGLPEFSYSQLLDGDESSWGFVKS